MSDQPPRSGDGPTPDRATEGARARAAGRPRDACPYPLDSPERRSWLEGYEGLPAERAADPPLDRG